MALLNIFKKNKENTLIVKKSTLNDLTFSPSEAVSKGMHGENNILAELHKCNIPKWILHDVYLLDDFSNSKAQIDFIVVTPYAILIIESKYIEATTIVISDWGHKVNGNFCTGNPFGEQVERQKRILINILQHSSMNERLHHLLPNFVHGLVIFSNTDGTITNNCENEIKHNTMFSVKDLMAYLQNLKPSYFTSSLLNDKECYTIANTILQKHNEDKLKEFYLHSQKNNYKKKIHRNIKNTITNNIPLIPCTNPACTGHFLLRKKQDGNSYFAGCSNFKEKDCRKKLSVAEYAFKLLQQNGIKIYSWSQKCYSCYKTTTVYTYLLHYDLITYDKLFKDYLSDLKIGMGKVYSDLATDNRYNLPQLDEYLKILSSSRSLGIDWTDGKKAGGKYLANHCQHCGIFQGRAHTVDNPPADIHKKIEEGTLIGEDWSISCNHAGITLDLLETMFQQS